MCHHDKGDRFSGGEVGQYLKYLGTRQRIKVARRLVGEDDIRLGHQSAGQRHTLHLAAGKLCRQMVHAIGQTDLRKKLCCMSARTFRQ